MQGEARARIVSIDEAGVGREVPEARLGGGTGRQARKESGITGHGRPLCGSTES